MESATKQKVISAFLAFMARQGLPVALSYKDVGSFSLDYNPHYGGYRIIKYLDSGAELDITERFSAVHMLAFFRISSQFDLNKGR